MPLILTKAANIKKSIIIESITLWSAIRCGPGYTTIGVIIENINVIEGLKSNHLTEIKKTNVLKASNKNKKSTGEKIIKITTKKIKKKSPRTLWVRRKKKIA